MRLLARRKLSSGSIVEIKSSKASARHGQLFYGVV
jgi:hypothetical protein